MKAWVYSNSKCLKNKSGLLLFEVTIAVAIVSIGVVFILRALTRTLNSIKVITRYYQALQLLENKNWDLQILNVKEYDLEQVMDKEGEFKDHPNFFWSIALEPEDDNLNKLELTVSWPQDGTRQSIGVTTYVRSVTQR